MSTTLSPAPTRPVLTGVLDWLGVGPLAFDDALAALNPLWTVFRHQGRVVQRIAETPSSCTLVIRTSARYPALQPGQHVLVTVEIEGVRHRRAYSPRTVDAADHTIAITVQRQPYGLVSNWLNEQIEIGDVVELSAPAGDFLLPTPVPAEVLMVAGGSGITPCRAMIDALHRTDPSVRVTLLYFARSPQERIFASEFEKLAARWSNFRYLPVDSQANLPAATRAGQPVLDRALLDRALPNWADVPTWCCGPAPLMDAARRLWSEAGSASRLMLESFGFAAAPVPSGEARVFKAVFQRDGQEQVFPARSDQPLLVAGEASGLSLPFGCRQGVCHECTCRLEQGTVVDLQTGQQLAAEGQNIRLCVTSAASELRLAPAGQSAS